MDSCEMNGHPEYTAQVQEQSCLLDLVQKLFLLSPNGPLETSHF